MKLTSKQLKSLVREAIDDARQQSDAPPDVSTELAKALVKLVDRHSEDLYAYVMRQLDGSHDGPTDPDDMETSAQQSVERALEAPEVRAAMVPVVVQVLSLLHHRWARATSSGD